jgi:light-regulated signal transduction histidine kinase (bacteriophytochrome)
VPERRSAETDHPTLRTNIAVLRAGGLITEGPLAKLGQQSLKLCVTELSAIVDDVIPILEPDCEGLEVERRIAKLPTLECDPILMAQFFKTYWGML